MMQFEKYVAMAPGDRVHFLNKHVTDNTDLTEEFCIAALQQEDSPLAKWYLVKALGILRSTEAIDLLLTVCEQPDVDFDYTSLYRITAWSLGRIGTPAFDSVMSLLSSTEQQCRLLAVDALGEMGKPEAVEALCTLLQNDVQEVKLWTALSLAKIGESALPCLHELVLSSPDLPTGLLALDAIMKIGSSSSRLVVRRILESGSVDEKRFVLEHIKDFWHSSLLPSLYAVADLEDDECLSKLAEDILAHLELPGGP